MAGPGCPGTIFPVDRSYKWGGLVKLLARIRPHLTYANTMVTVLAFIVLAGGSAVALSGHNSVFSDDIAPGQVKPPDVDLVRSDHILAEESTASTSPVDLPNAGPRVTVKVPTSDSLVAIYAKVDIRGPVGHRCDVGLYEANLPSDSGAILSTYGDGAFETRYTAASSTGLTSPQTATWNVFPATKGTHTYTLKYFSEDAGQTCTYKRRNLWVAVLN
jgi:hypothetical protein